jgi:predicted CXXCH cytochrome family protein
MDSKKRTVVLLTGSLLLLFAIFACASQQMAPVAQPAASAAPKQEIVAQKAEPAPPPKPASPYAVEVSPLTPADCARCHSSVFNQIKNEGGKHKIDCVQCHTKFHAYNPVKQNWQEIMPKCQTCHGLIHGDKFAACSACHSNPHAPKTQMAMTAEFGKACGDCHAKVGQELQKNPSKHTKVQCVQCHHNKHGYIPSCMECHKPHSAEQTVKDCLACHPVHNPLKIAYPDTVKNDVCGGCHAAAFSKIRATTSKHGQVACAKCHSRHRYIPKCEECHGKPHGDVVLKKFPNCLQCHVDVHDLPSKTGKK